MRYGPRYGQTDKYGKPKCNTRTYANGGLTRKRKSNTSKKEG